MTLEEMQALPGALPVLRSGGMRSIAFDGRQIGHASDDRTDDRDGVQEQVIGMVTEKLGGALVNGVALPDRAAPLGRNEAEHPERSGLRGHLGLPDHPALFIDNTNARQFRRPVQPSMQRSHLASTLAMIAVGTKPSAEPGTKSRLRHLNETPFLGIDHARETVANLTNT